MQLFCKNSFRYLSGALLIFFAACTSLPSAVPETQATLPVTQPALPDPPAAITAPPPTATPDPQSMLAVSAEDLRGVMLGQHGNPAVLGITGACGNKPSHCSVFLEAAQIIDFTFYGGLREDPRGLLERSR